MLPRLKTTEENHKSVSAALVLDFLSLNSVLCGSEHPQHTLTQVSQEKQDIVAGIRQLRIFENGTWTSEGFGEALCCPQLPQTFPDHKNGPLLVVPPLPQGPGSHVQEVEGLCARYFPVSRPVGMGPSLCGGCGQAESSSMSSGCRVGLSSACTLWPGSG